MTGVTAHKMFRVLGTTDDVTECELCGRAELKGTVVLAELDADGNEMGVVYYGSACGARAAGWTTKEVRKAAKDADTAVRAAWSAWQDAQSSHYIKLWTADLGSCPGYRAISEWEKRPEVQAQLTTWAVANPAPTAPKGYAR